MNWLNRQTPIENALGWGHVIEDTGYWVMPDGKVYPINDKMPERSDKKGSMPNIAQSGLLVDLVEYNRIGALAQSGDIDDVGTQGIREDLYDKFVLFDETLRTKGHHGMQYVMDQIAQSGPIQMDDFANVKRIRDAVFFWGKSYRSHILTDMVSQFTTNYLDFEAIRFTPPDNQVWQDMGFYALPDMTKGKYDKLTKGLKSDAYLFSITEDFYYNDYVVNPIADHERALNAEVELAMHKKIADPIKAIASGASLDWTTLNASNLVTVADPADDIRALMTTLIKADRWNVDSILSNYPAILKYTRNARVNGDISDIAKVERPSLLTGIATNIKYLPGIRWGWDDLLDEGSDIKFIAYAREAFKLVLGPRKVARVFDPISSTTTNLVRYWCAFHILDWGAPTTEVYAKRTVT